MTRLPAATKTSIELALAMGVSGRQVARAFFVYEDASRLSKETGIKHEVDHI